jgi:MerR family transcriptional regulator/heat shock protein HspR
MSSRYLKISDLATELHVDAAFLAQLEAEELIHLKRTLEGEMVISTEDAEKVRLAMVLTGELEVNLPGVEVIMHMRDSMLAMHRQFAEILSALVDELRRQVVEGKRDE